MAADIAELKRSLPASLALDTEVVVLRARHSQTRSNSYSYALPPGKRVIFREVKSLDSNAHARSIMLIRDGPP